MGSPFAGFVLDPLKCSKLTMEEKREIVYELSKSSQGAPELLQSWSRRELLQILCAEMGKERKYTGLTKIKMIEHLLKIVSQKNSARNENVSERKLRPPPATGSQTFSKRQRKADCPIQVTAMTNQNSNGCEDTIDNVVYCKNSACRASLRLGDAFCRRCSCCICFKYDDNKDPSIWLVCNSDPPNKGDSCGLSCHLECASKNERAGLMKGGIYPKLDGSFYCVSCKKVNDLLGCCQKQLLIAKDARRVDTLCYRIILSRKLLNGTEKYQCIMDKVETAARKLEEEVGALDGLPSRMARGIVNRLSCGPEVQKLCTSALKLLDSIMSSYLHRLPEVEHKVVAPPFCIKFEDISASSLTIVLKSGDAATSGEVVDYKFWHREADTEGYPAVPTCTLVGTNNKFSISGLSPGTTYMLKVVSFNNGRELECETKFTTSDNHMKSLSISSSGRHESKASGDKCLNNWLQTTSEIRPEIPRGGGSPHNAHESESRLMLRYEVSGQKKVASDSVSTLDEEGVTCGTISNINLILQTESQRGSTNSLDENQALDVPEPENKNNSESNLLEGISNDNESNANEADGVQANHSESVLPSTPCKQEMRKDGTRNTENWSPETQREPQNGSCSKKKNAASCQQDNCARDGSVEREYEYCVKVVRWLECEGHMQKSFREKFLTWFSLKATPQERKIVSVFVETLIDDPPSLAGQLMDTFAEGISSKRPAAVPTGFCMKLWH